MNSIVSVKKPKLFWIPGFNQGIISAGILAVRASSLSSDVVTHPMTALCSGFGGESTRFCFSTLWGETLVAH